MSKQRCPICHEQHELMKSYRDNNGVTGSIICCFDCHLLNNESFRLLRDSDDKQALLAKWEEK